MLENQGFFLQAGAYANRSVNSIIEECNQNFHDGEVVILNVSQSVIYGRYIPIVPIVQNDNVRYVLQYPIDLLHLMATEVWIAWKDGQDHSIMPRRKSTKAASVRENKTEERVGD